MNPTLSLMLLGLLIFSVGFLGNMILAFKDYPIVHPEPIVKGFVIFNFFGWFGAFLTVGTIIYTIVKQRKKP